MANLLDQAFALLRQHRNALQQQGAQIAQLSAMVSDLGSRPRSPDEMIDDLPGRVIESVVGGEVTFDTTLGRGSPITITVSQDGPFVWAYYPVVMWRPSLPSNATNLGRWRPVSSFPLPTQQLTTDFIDIMWEMSDGGSQRNFQQSPRAPLFSRPDVLLPCAKPTLFAAGSSIVFTPTYTAVNFGGGTPTTQGTLHVDFYGFRLANM